MELYFEYNYLQSKFPIYIHQQEVFGEIDLNEFHSSVTLFEDTGKRTYRGQLLMHEKSKKFTLITNTWALLNEEETMLGSMKERIFSLHKRYDYTASDGNDYSFICKLFSRNYTVIDRDTNILATVQIKYGNIKSEVRLLPHSNEVDLLELMTALTGIFVLERKRNN